MLSAKSLGRQTFPALVGFQTIFRLPIKQLLKTSLPLKSISSSVFIDTYLEKKIENFNVSFLFLIWFEVHLEAFGGIGRVGHHQLVEKKISRWEKASDFSHAPFPPPLQMYSFPQNANKFPHLLENIQIYFCKYISTSYEQHTNIFPPRFDSIQTYSTSFGHSTNTQIYFFLRILDFPIKDHLLKLI